MSINVLHLIGVACSIYVLYANVINNFYICQTLEYRYASVIDRNDIIWNIECILNIACIIRSNK